MRETLKTRDHQSMIAGAKELIVLIPVFAVTGDCLPISTVGCGNPVCITQINGGVLVYVVHAVGCLCSAVVGSL